MRTRTAAAALSLLTVGLPGAALARASAQSSSQPAASIVAPPPATVTPFVEHERVSIGQSARTVLRVVLPAGFHANSNKPRDPLLVPMRLTIDAPPGVTVTEVVFPEATDFTSTSSPQPLLVYQGTFAIGVALRLAPDLTPGTLTIPVHLRYQACNETTCFFPKTIHTSWTLKAIRGGTKGAAAHPEIFGRIAFGSGEAPGATASATASSPSASSSVATAASGAESSSAASSAAPAGTLATLDDFEVGGITGGYLSADDFLKFVGNAEAGVKPAGLFDGRGPLAILLIVFVGGLALNLTPCVLPMIPINLAIIGAGARSSSRGRGLVLGAAYGGAMALVYGVLGVVVILTAGTFGTINASPWFNVAIALIFLVLALAMFDRVGIDFSRFSSRFQPDSGSGSGGGSVGLAFGMGSVAALLAGACVAPVVIQVVLFASNLYAGGTSAALALPFVLGLGMAIPWPIAGAGVAALPKPGAWMVRVKQVFGVLILATALYYGYEAYRLFADRWVDPAEVTASVEAQLESGWQASLDRGLAEAKREGKPVLVDFWATWCKNCLTMDVTTFRNERVKAAIEKYVKIKYQAESPDESPAREILARFKAVGLPTYVILKPR